MNSFIEFSIIICVAYFLYWAFLMKSKLFEFTRFFLLIALVLSLISPLVKFESNVVPPIVMALNPTNIFETENLELQNLSPLANSQEINESSSLLLHPVWFIYFAICGIFLFRFGKNLFKIISLAQTSSKFIGGLKLVLFPKQTAPFSFFSYLFVSKNLYENDKPISNTIIKHERVHSQQLHSLDIIFIEFVTCFLWFHPVVWLFKKAMVQNHEYIVDANVIKNGVNQKDYSSEIIETVTQFTAPPLVSGFSYIQIKNRIDMIGKTQNSTRVKLSKMAIAIVLFGAVFTLNSFKEYNSNPFVVVLDAGHGGKDPGFTTGELLEKEINLNICRKIAALSKKGEVEIIMSRPNDEFVSLQDRVNFIKTQNADLLLSIHSEGNSAVTREFGITAFYPRYDTINYVSKRYAQLLITNGVGELKQGKDSKPARFMVLKKLNCPGVLLSLGNMENEVEGEILQSEKGQDKIAEDIYNKLLKIKRMTK